jgi:protoporphyrinogen oxidase
VTEFPSVGVVGAGILGSAITMRLAQAGVAVTLLERSERPGGLAATMDFGGSRVDRFYHVIVPSDERMIGLIDELGLSDALSFSPVGVGFYIDGTMYPFNGIGDFLRFPALSPTARARLAWFVVQCQLRKGYDRLDGMPLERWLRRHCGDEVTDRIWRPLLDSRFDGSHDELPATYLWARTNRMRSARKRGGEEQMGCLVGGHETLVDAMIERSRWLGAEIRLGAGVERLVLEDGAVVGVAVDGELQHFDQTIVTLQPQALTHLLPAQLSGLLSAYPERYLGVVCLVLKVRRTLLPYYSVNICDPTPITTVVETSHVVGTAHTDGMALVYLPKYCEASAPEFSEPDAVIYRRFTEMLARIVPDFDHADVVDWTVQRAPIVEPVHALGHTPRVAPIDPSVPGLALASATQVYPRLLNGESLLQLAEAVTEQTLTRNGRREPSPVVA